MVSLLRWRRRCASRGSFCAAARARRPALRSSDFHLSRHKQRVTRALECVVAIDIVTKRRGSRKNDPAHWEDTGRASRTPSVGPSICTPHNRYTASLLCLQRTHEQDDNNLNDRKKVNSVKKCPKTKKTTGSFKGISDKLPKYLSEKKY